MEDELEDFLRQLVAVANQSIELMDGTTGPIKQLFEAGEIVIGVWQDLSQPYGIDFHVLKGAKLLLETIASDNNVTALSTVIRCECFEQAIAAKQKFGTTDHDA